MYSGAFLLLLIVVGEIILCLMIKKNWKDLSKRSNNIFYMICMIAGAISFPFILMTFINKFF